MKKIFLCFFIALFLVFSTTAQAGWFFSALRLLGSVGMKTLDVTSKVTSTMGAVDAMRARRENPNFEVSSLRYDDGKIFLDEGYSFANQHDSEIAEELWREAWKKADAKKHLSAKRLYEQSLSLNANKSSTWHGYGWTLSQLNQHDAAHNAFTTAIYLNNYSGNLKHEQESDSWWYLGWNYQKQGYLKDAQLSYQEALVINPGHKRARAGLVSIPSEIPNIAGSKKYRIKGSGVRFRALPSAKSRILESFPYEADVNLLAYKGKKIKIKGIAGRWQWAQVSYQGKVGYVFGAYLQKLIDGRNDVNKEYVAVLDIVDKAPPSVNLSPTRTRNQESDRNRHFHGQRVHSHILPTTGGVMHAHNNGLQGSLKQEGVIVQSPPRISKPAPGKYAVQAGAFSMPQNAGKYLAGLKNAGYNNLVVLKRTKSGKHLYYVEFVGFNDLQAAKIAQNKITSVNMGKSFFAKKVE